MLCFSRYVPLAYKSLNTKKFRTITKNHEDIGCIGLFGRVQRKEAHKLYNKLGYDENADKAFVKYILIVIKLQ